VIIAARRCWRERTVAHQQRSSRDFIDIRVGPDRHGRIAQRRFDGSVMTAVDSGHFPAWLAPCAGDIQAAMKNTNSTALIRVPFVVTNARPSISSPCG